VDRTLACGLDELNARQKASDRGFKLLEISSSENKSPLSYFF